jgi:hypothetical protein
MDLAPGDLLAILGEDFFYLTESGHRGEGLPPDHPNRTHSIASFRHGRPWNRFAISDVAEGSDTWLPDAVRRTCERLLVTAGYGDTIE